MTEFSPTYSWQRVYTDQKSLPKGLDVQMNVFGDDDVDDNIATDTSLEAAAAAAAAATTTTTTSSSSFPPSTDTDRGNYVYARIPPTWRFQTYIKPRAAKPGVRAGFARVDVTAKTKVWDLALGIAKRARAEPEQLTFMLNKSLCLSTHALGHDMVRANVILNHLEKVYNNLKKWIYIDISRSMLFEVKHCLDVVVNDTIILHPDTMWLHIQDQLECKEQIRCQHRHTRLEECNRLYENKDGTLRLERCLWPLMLLEACNRKCNFQDELKIYGHTKQSYATQEEWRTEKLMDERYEVGTSRTKSIKRDRENNTFWVFDHGVWNYSEPSIGSQFTNTEMIPHESKTFLCHHCLMVDGHIQLPGQLEWNFNDLENPLSYSRHVSYYNAPPQVYLHLHIKTQLRFQRMKAAEKEHLEKHLEKEQQEENIGHYSGGSEQQPLVLTPSSSKDGENGENEKDEKDHKDEQDHTAMTEHSASSEYKCQRRYVHPVLHLSVWSILNMYHILWDLVIPILRIVRDVFQINVPTPIHLFLAAGHPWMRSRLQRILRGDYAPEGISPLGYLLRRITHGVPIHSTSWLERLSGTSCFDYFYSGIFINPSDPFGHALKYTKEGFEAWSVMSTKRGEMYDSGDYRDEALHQSSNAQSLVGSILLQEYSDTMKSRPSYSKFVRSTLRTLGILREKEKEEGSSLLLNGQQSQQQRLILFIRREGSRMMLNRHRLAEIATERVQEVENINVESSVRLEELSFIKQLRLFRSTAILVGVHGQGCANTMFMKGGGRSALLMTMPLDFFGWHHVYANAAVSLGVHVIVLMRYEDGPVDGWKRGRDNDRVNEKRDENFHVMEEMFEDGLELALSRVTQDGRLSGDGSDEEGDDGDENSRNGMVVDVEYVRAEQKLEFKSILGS